ncbi:polysaccharide biosynthesis/export family protein [Psychrobacter sp. JCM 18903]|uniref:polysaccharide biosynthesis/export family protein n=1 Tax=Psychrobacter sp. JCM 18903 TaxID=1298610 RepID=UPI0004B3AAEC|nr:polysaccharide biosynthesis/export family protein [Psychrobacter sp. JCM 18903]
MVYKYFISVQKRSLIASASCLLLTVLLSSCTINSGLQSGKLPESGTFTAENGLQFYIQPLSLANLPAKEAVILDRDLYHLVKTSGRVSYGIAKGDVLNIILTNYPDINASTSSLTVDQQGFIQFPLIGRVKASGLSVPQFTATLQSKLQRYLKYSDPQVKIINYRGSKFFVDGEVKQSGEFVIADVPISVYGAISMAGGTTDTGDSNHIVLNRQGKSYKLGIQSLNQMGLSANQIYLQDGDAIHVNSQSAIRSMYWENLAKLSPLLFLSKAEPSACIR